MSLPPMLPTQLVRPLEPSWQEILDGVLRARSAPVTSDVARLGAKVAELSKAYNAGLAGDARGRAPLPLEARIGFSFARDVPKGAGAVRELVATGTLAMPEGRALRVLDLGAGLGAMSWGIARALEAAGAHGRVETLLVDEDEAALAAGKAIAAKAKGLSSAIELGVETRVQRLAPGMRVPASDVVVLGQVLSELDLGLGEAERVERHVALLSDLLRTAVAPGGSLVVVEPALRDRTRHLHAVRDRVLSQGNAMVFAPCLHALACPAFAVEGEWCHEDVLVDLPEWLVPVARAAGLRWQGLTFSYLVLRSAGPTLAGMLPEPSPSRVHLRVISDLLRSKGKTELFSCTSAGDRVRMRHLDRDVTEANEAWGELHRGDVVTLRTAGDATTDPPVDERGRLSRSVEIDVWPFRK